MTASSSDQTAPILGPEPHASRNGPIAMAEHPLARRLALCRQAGFWAVAFSFLAVSAFSTAPSALYGPGCSRALIGTGHDPSRLFIGYALGGALMIVGGVVELLLGVAAEGELEQVARPLTAVPASQVPRAPMPRGQYLPHTTPPSQVSVGA